MTYNFDPDRWYDIEADDLSRRFENGELSGAEYDEALEELERRYADMLRRLDGSYQLPKKQGPL